MERAGELWSGARSQSICVSCCRALNELSRWMGTAKAVLCCHVSDRGQSKMLGFIFSIKIFLFVPQGEENTKQLVLTIVNVHGARREGRGRAATGKCCSNKDDVLL